MQQEVLDFSSHQLYHQFFPKCPELSLIARPFSFGAVAQEPVSRDLEAEFELLRALTETKKHKLKLRVNSILQNKKNRYPEQSIYEHSRVTIDDHDGEGYINANWVPMSNGMLIITQGPLQHTQDQFEQMIVDNKVECVAMLCNIMEGGKVRCFDYTANRQISPPSSSDQNAPITISTVSFEQGEYRHVHYSQWPDRSVPEDVVQVKTLLQELQKYDRVAIHCSAGLGRSGVIACLLSIMQQIKKGEDFSVFGTALRLREHRFGAIQNSEQYSFIYKFLSYLHSTQQ